MKYTRLSSPVLLWSSQTLLLVSSCTALVGTHMPTVGTARPACREATTMNTQQQQTQQQPSAFGALLLSSSNSNNHQALEGEQENSAASASAVAEEKNKNYIQGLLDNLAKALDKYILSGSPKSLTQVQNIFSMIESQAKQDEWIQQAQRMVQRAGVSVPPSRPKITTNANNTVKREKEVEQRRQWEISRLVQAQEQTKAEEEKGRSALSRRQASNRKHDLFMGQIDQGLDPIASGTQDKLDLEKALLQNIRSDSSSSTSSFSSSSISSSDEAAVAQVAELVARAGASSGFDGQALGIGGLDDVLSQVKRRVWTPLAAPPRLLKELGICPVRGLLLYGRPGCGKTLLARQLGQILSPLRPITVVSGPEILDKFVGSSEKNLRNLFDNPPEIYDFYRIGQADGGDAIARAALHVVVMDEFDAIARTRGGQGGTGEGQGDAGVARDSVVNQLLAKMDGVEPLVVPTMVIGLTNKRSLIDPALLRPGRFEVQIEVPPPRTIEQRVSIFKVHTSSMHKAGRLLLSDSPFDSPAARKQEQEYGDRHHLLPTYEELLVALAMECEGFSGAALAGVTRAAASHALERAVDDFMDHVNDASILHDCVVMQSDFDAAIQDVRASMGDSDWSNDFETDNKEDNSANDSVERNGIEGGSSDTSNQNKEEENVLDKVDEMAN